jgi:hypothetical protein
VDPAVRQVAAISFKNLVKRDWDVEGALQQPPPAAALHSCLISHQRLQMQAPVTAVLLLCASLAGVLRATLSACPRNSQQLAEPSRSLPPCLPTSAVILLPWCTVQRAKSAHWRKRTRRLCAV